MCSNRWNENWQGKPKYSEKISPSAICPPQIQRNLAWNRTRVIAVTCQQLTSWAMVRPYTVFGFRSNIEYAWTLELFLRIWKYVKMVVYKLCMEYISHVTKHNRSGRCSCKALDLYSGAAWFESRPGLWLSWLKTFMIFFGPSKQSRDKTSILAWTLPFRSFLIHQSPYHSTLYSRH
jgi:hypothetical protein